MIAGTASDVGKSVVCTAFCRIFKQDGFHPAPFKAQNMSLNSYVTPDGLEIGRAQATQAEAAGIPCHTHMNPVLLKPTSHTSSQIVLNGKPFGNQSAYQYFRGNNRNELFSQVTASFDALQAQHNPIVMEGAGSICELNLKHRDIVNMRMALHANAATILVADIERGGIFANLYGTIKLLPEEEQKLIKGIIVNKFRGDSRLFEDGKKIIEDLTGVPVLGILPHFTDIMIEEEDSVVLDHKNATARQEAINVCVVRLPRMSNFTDFRVFEYIPEVHLYYADDPKAILNADIIIVPGSKNTIEDLIAIKQKKIDEALHLAVKKQKRVIGICGGYQMLGQQIDDPDHVESEQTSIEGIGLLPLHTTLTKDKHTVQAHFAHRHNVEAICRGYEIHMGRSTVTQDNIESVNTLEGGTTDGVWKSKYCWGSYMHGIFDNKTVLEALLSDFKIASELPDFHRMKEDNFDKLADTVRQNVDMEKIYDFLK